MIKSDHLKKPAQVASDYNYTLEEFSITIPGQEEIIHFANDNFCKISTYSTKELIRQDHYSIFRFHTMCIALQ